MREVKLHYINGMSDEELKALLYSKTNDEDEEEKEEKYRIKIEDQNAEILLP